MNITSTTPLMNTPTAQTGSAAPDKGSAPEQTRVNLPVETSQQPAQAAQAAVTNEKLTAMLEKANQKMRGGGDVQFAVHEGSNRVVVRLIDPKSMEVIREFPNTELLDVLTKLQELSGLNVDKVT